jgi:hypothetical protein
MLHPNANVERIQLWADALLSDEFTQGRNYLAYQLEDGSPKHCCLGVACEVAIAHGLEISRCVGEGPDQFGRHHIAYDGERYMLPKKVMDWYGLTGDTAVSLIRPGLNGPIEATGPHLNDELKVRFTGIARVLATTFDFRLDLSEVPDGE